jgi:hypothetical protein
MSSEVARKVAGTFIADSTLNAPPVFAWLRDQTRRGYLAQYVQQFCRDQPELLDPALVQIESLSGECIQGWIPCKLFDHESNSPFAHEVHFRLNPQTGQVLRL